MSLTSWRPLSARIGAAPDPGDTLYEGVPEHLVGPLEGWLQEFVDSFLVTRICLRLRIAVNGAPEEWLVEELGEERGPYFLIDAVDTALQLGVVDGWMRNELAARARKVQARVYSPDTQGHFRSAAQPPAPDPYENGGPLGTLASILDDAGSAYRIREDTLGLEPRVDPTALAAFAAARAAAAANPVAGSATDHLSVAWAAAYGLNPDPTRAYSEAIKAIESAAHAVIETNNTKATLGTMLGIIKATPTKFAVAVPAPTSTPTSVVAMVEAMMRTVWEGQTARHGGKAPTRTESLEAARFAIHLAVTLVQGFTSGAITKVP